MYAIANVIYGIPITDKVAEVIEMLENSLPDDIEGEYPPENFGFTTPYHGGHYRTVGWFGISLAEFDESRDFPLSDIVDVKPTEDEMAEVKDKISKLPKEILEVASPPDVYIVWSTS